MTNCLFDFFHIRKFDQRLLDFYSFIYRSNNRKKISSQKNRSLVNFSNVKPWKQKGTGRARAGSKSSPLWKGGGRAFPNNSLKSYKKKINKKVRLLAIMNIYIYGFSYNKIFFLNFPEIYIIKCYLSTIFLDRIGSKGKVLLVFDFNLKKELFLTVRNIKNVYVTDYFNFDPYYILSYDLVFFDLSYFWNFLYLINEKFKF